METFLAKLNSKIKKENGSALVLTAIMIPLFFLIAGFVIDIGRAFLIKEEMNKACMIAAEEASKYIDIDAAEEYGINTLSDGYNNIIQEFFYYNFSERENFRINYLNHSISGGIDNPKYIEVSCEGEVNCFFLKLIAIEKIKVHSTAKGRLRRIK